MAFWTNPGPLPRLKNKQNLLYYGKKKKRIPEEWAKHFSSSTKLPSAATDEGSINYVNYPLSNPPPSAPRRNN